MEPHIEYPKLKVALAAALPKLRSDKQNDKLMGKSSTNN
jgi:hypothetical protein